MVSALMGISRLTEMDTRWIEVIELILRWLRISL